MRPVMENKKMLITGFRSARMPEVNGVGASVKDIHHKRNVFEKDGDYHEG